MRYRLRTLLIVLALGPQWVACTLQAEDDAPNATLSILGKWRVTAAESLGRIDPNANEEDKVWDFHRDSIVVRQIGNESVRLKCSYDSRTEPMRVEWECLQEDLCVRGIWKIDGGSLQICARIGDREKPPEFPKEFKSLKGDSFVKLLLFSREDD